MALLYRPLPPTVLSWTFFHARQMAVQRGLVRNPLLPPPKTGFSTQAKSEPGLIRSAPNSSPAGTLPPKYPFTAFSAALGAPACLGLAPWLPASVLPRDALLGEEWAPRLEAAICLVHHAHAQDWSQRVSTRIRPTPDVLDWRKAVHAAAAARLSQVVHATCSPSPTSRWALARSLFGKSRSGRLLENGLTAHQSALHTFGSCEIPGRVGTPARHCGACVVSLWAKKKKKSDN